MNPLLLQIVLPLAVFAALLLVRWSRRDQFHAVDLAMPVRIVFLATAIVIDAIIAVIWILYPDDGPRSFVCVLLTIPALYLAITGKWFRPIDKNSN